MQKFRQTGCTEVNRWIKFSLISLPIYEFIFGLYLLNRSRTGPSMASFSPLWFFVLYLRFV